MPPRRASGSGRSHAEMGSVSGGGIHKIGSSVALAATPNSGYKFVGWYHGTELLSTDASYTFAMPNCVNNYDVEGRFLLNSYNLVLSSEDTAKGSVTGAGSYDYATPVSISAAAENGYTFSGWYSGTTLISSANPYSFTMPYTDLNYVAKFNTNSYKLSLTYDSSKGYVSGTGAYSYGSSVTISATAKSGYSFSGWYDGETLVSSSGSYSFSMKKLDLGVGLSLWYGGSITKTSEGRLTTVLEMKGSACRDYEERLFVLDMRDDICETCHGARLNEAALSVQVNGLNIYQATQLTIDKLLLWLDDTRSKLSANELQIADLLLKEIHNRAQFLVDVGLDYLTLDRLAMTLSGGEAQRIRLATQIGSRLSGVLYVLDEPSIGLHQRDNAKLIKTLKEMRDLGNTLIVVEHGFVITDEKMMSSCAGLFAIGDIVKKNLRQVVTACSDGAVASQSILAYRRSLGLK